MNSPSSSELTVLKGLVAGNVDFNAFYEYRQRGLLFSGWEELDPAGHGPSWWV